MSLETSRVLNRRRGNQPGNVSTIDDSHGSLQTRLRCLYGEETYFATRKLEKYRTRKQKLLNQLAFLCRCREEAVIPGFLKVKHHVQTRSAQRILHRASTCLLRERIRDTRKHLDQTERELLEVHLWLTSKLDRNAWDLVDKLTNEKSSLRGEETNAKQKSKIEKLLLDQRPKQTNTDKPRTVINLASIQLEEDAMEVLAKGLNFAIAPKTIPREEIISALETTCRRLPADVAEEVRADAAHVLRTAKPPKPNLSKREIQALKDLQKNEAITILPADKGNATVLLNTADYIAKVEDMLLDPVYKKIRNNPVRKVEKEVATAIRSSNIPKDNHRSLIQTDSRTPQLYCLPKIHKPDIPLRPIVSAAGSATHPLARYVAQEIKDLVGKTEHHVKNAGDFIEKIRGIQLQPDDILVSFDVTSLFTKVPIDEALEELQRRLVTEDKDVSLVELARVCIKSTFFEFRGQFYEQTEGAAMGSPLSPVLANTYMEAFEKKALDSAMLKPKCWYRYVDDTFIIWPHGRSTVAGFLDHINGIHPDIQFTMEVEKNAALPFLDVLVERKPDGTLGHRVYRKQTHTDRYLNAESHHHPAQKQGVINTLVHRARIISEPKYLEEELGHLRTALRGNGFTVRNIDRAIRRNHAPKDRPEHLATTYLPYVKGCTDKIGRLLKKRNIGTVFSTVKKVAAMFPKSCNSDHLQGPGVYSIPCSCGKVYIGQTGRHINTRLKEHKSHLKNNNWEKSAVAEHRADTGHAMELSEASVLVRERRFWPRLYREAIEIHKNPNNFNRDNGVELPGVWKRVIRESSRLESQGPVARRGEHQQRVQGYPPERHGQVKVPDINRNRTGRSPVSE